MMIKDGETTTIVHETKCSLIFFFSFKKLGKILYNLYFKPDFKEHYLSYFEIHLFVFCQ